MTTVRPTEAAWRASPAGYGLKLIPGYKLWRHIAAASRAYVEAMSVPGSRLIINMPNQLGKSLCTSVLGPLWMLDHWPELRVMLITHGIEFGSVWGRSIRNLAADNEDVLRMRIVGGRDAKERQWQTTEGGGLFATSIDRVAGRPADRIVIDDPYASWREAHSETVRKAVQTSWETDVQGRIRDETSVCITATRYHAADLTGHLTDPKQNPEAGRWKVVRIPALGEASPPHPPHPPDALADVRKPGETVDPRAVSAELMASRKRTVGSYFWQGMYGQMPSPDEGGIFKRSWWQWYSTLPGLPHFSELLSSWDMAFKDADDSDYVVGQVWGRIGADYFLLDQVRDRMSFTETLKAVEALSAKWPSARAKLIEDAANGPAVINTLHRRVPGLIPVQPQGSKVARARAVSPLVEAGNVHLPVPERAPWVMEFVEEHAVFDGSAGGTDDRVDACTQALYRLSLHVLGAGQTKVQDRRDRGRR